MRKIPKVVVDRETRKYKFGYIPQIVSKPSKETANMDFFKIENMGLPIKDK